MHTRNYDAATDREAVHRIWHEIGWIDTDQESERQALDAFLNSGDVRVALVHDAAECMVSTHAAELRYRDTDLPLSAVTGVTVGRAGRKLGLATRLTAQAVAEDAAAGVPVSVLSMFEQGFYDRLGFGTGGYAHLAAFDPSDLAVDVAFRPPHRLTVKDSEAIHRARLSRLKFHGACSLTDAGYTQFNVQKASGGFGLGYYDGPDDALSHCIWVVPDDREYGPYFINMFVYQTGSQLLELLSLVRSLGDQVRLVRCLEPPHVQIQDVLKRPIARRIATNRSRYEAGVQSLAFWQIRICDLSVCIACVKHGHEPLRFNLVLADPIEQHLDGGYKWRGMGGEYVVTLSGSSEASLGRDESLPTVRTTVNALSRMWIGAAIPSNLAVLGVLDAPPELLPRLDEVFCLPKPEVDWEF